MPQHQNGKSRHHSNDLGLSTAFNIIQLLTVAVGIFRLAFRLKIRRFWWEDVWAAMATAGAIAYTIANFIFFRANNLEIFKVTDLADYYLFTCIIWSVRMSLLYSIIRIIPPRTILYSLACTIGVLFFITWAILIALKAWVCTSFFKYTLQSSACLVSNGIAAFELAADVVGDVILVVFSLRLLWRVKLPRRQRRMILLIFSSSAIMSVLSLPHAIFQLVHNVRSQFVLANLELIASLVICNLLVVVTYVYRVFLSSSESECSSEDDDDDFTTPMSRSTASLTTVDLNTPDLST